MDISKTLVGALGIEVVEVGDGTVTATMPVDERTRQPMGYLHGGASVALAETVASVGAYHLVNQETEFVVGLEINANHIKSKKDGIVTATGTAIHRGKATMVWEVKIVDEQNQLICLSRCTIAIIKRK